MIFGLLMIMEIKLGQFHQMKEKTSFFMRFFGREKNSNIIFHSRKIVNYFF